MMPTYYLTLAVGAVGSGSPYHPHLPQSLGSFSGPPSGTILLPPLRSGRRVTLLPVHGEVGEASHRSPTHSLQYRE